MKKIILFFLLLGVLFISSCGKKTYEVKFYVFDELVKTESVKQGASANAPVVNKEGYTFNGWDKSFDKVESNLDVHAIMEGELIDVFYYYGAEYLGEEQVASGEAAKFIAPEMKGHTFKGFDQDLSCVTETLDVQVLYDINVYTVTFKDGDKTIATVEVEYMKNVKAPTYKVEGHSVRWDSSLNSITEDKTINAILTPETYSVKFYNLYEDLVDTKYVDYNNEAIPPVLEEVERYEFLGWDTDLTHITDNCDVYPVYNKLLGGISYSINGEIVDYLSPTTFKLNEAVTLPTPNVEGYSFVGWTLNPISLTTYDMITEDMNEDYTFYAILVETTPHKTFSEIDADFVITDINKHRYTEDQSVKEYNLWLYSPILTSAAPSQSLSAYTWSTTDSKIATISEWGSISPMGHGYCYVFGRLKADSNKTVKGLIYSSVDGIRAATVEETKSIELFNVTFKDDEGNILSTQVVQKDGAAIGIKAPVKEGYYFTGWDKDFYGITEDTIVTATYAPGTPKYEGKTFAVIGDSISTYKPNIPEGFAHFYPYPTGDISDINKTWWMQTINGLGGQLFIDNSWSGSCVCGNSASAAQTIDRLKYTVFQGETPDVILIYMGSNDIRTYPVESWLKANDKMLSILKEICPDSEIIYIELFTSNFYDANIQASFNAATHQLAEKYNFKVLSTASVDVRPYLIDSVHPLASGHKVMADAIIKELRG